MDTNKSIMSAERLRMVCIRQNWFTAGTNSQYSKLFAMNQEGASAEELALVIWVCSENADRDKIRETLASESLIERSGITKAPEKKFEITIKRTCRLTDGDIFELIVTALEGGINYWACLDNSEPAFKGAPKYEAVSETAAKIICDGGRLFFEDVYEPDERWELTGEKIAEGIRLYIENGYDRYGVFKDDMADMSLCDAECADTIFQLALFGDIVYG